MKKSMAAKRFTNEVEALRISEKISKIAKLYNKTKKIYNVAIMIEHDSREANSIIPIEEYSKLIKTKNSRKFQQCLHDFRYDFWINEIRTHKQYGPALLKDMKYEMKKLQRELAKYVIE